VWARRDFATAVAVGEIRSQNMDTVLGNLWHILNPLLLIGIYYLVFGVILGLTERGGVDNFLAFLAVGVFAFHYSQKCVMAGAKSIVGNLGLIRSIAFPRAVKPLSTVIGQTLAFVPAIAVMLVVSAFTGEPPRPAWLAIVPIFVLQGLFNLGAALIAARLTDAFHDLQNILPFVFRLLFYMSGVLYSVDRFIADDRLRSLFLANPFYVYLSLARAPIMDEVDWDPTLAAAAVAWTVVGLVAGFFYFRAGEENYGRG
jgi:teichoic acid transport system permease protein